MYDEYKDMLDAYCTDNGIDQDVYDVEFLFDDGDMRESKTISTPEPKDVDFPEAKDLDIDKLWGNRWRF